ncbi:hypothetical protein NIES2104_14640 [Leptolyngbya sp. NIES-2104]|nr:hypothetical protein NIES2104_14640 [Leptolyngbya sp. NIES-2104]
MLTNILQICNIQQKQANFIEKVNTFLIDCDGLKSRSQSWFKL